MTLQNNRLTRFSDSENFQTSKAANADNIGCDGGSPSNQEFLNAVFHAGLKGGERTWVASFRDDPKTAPASAWNGYACAGLKLPDLNEDANNYF